jgi:hypothetical protein
VLSHPSEDIFRWCCARTCDAKVAAVPQPHYTAGIVMHPDGDAGSMCMLHHEIALEMKMQMNMKMG